MVCPIYGNPASKLLLAALNPDIIAPVSGGSPDLGESSIVWCLPRAKWGAADPDSKVVNSTKPGVASGALSLHHCGREADTRTGLSCGVGVCQLLTARNVTRRLGG